MKFSLMTPAGANMITSYGKDSVVVDGQRLTSSFVIAPDALIADWRPQTFEDLNEEDLEQIVALDPEIALLGSGQTQRFPASRLLASFVNRGIGLEVMTTAAVCRTYNVIRGEDRRVVAALLLD